MKLELTSYYHDLIDIDIPTSDSRWESRMHYTAYLLGVICNILHFNYKYGIFAVDISWDGVIIPQTVAEIESLKAQLSALYTKWAETERTQGRIERCYALV